MQLLVLRERVDMCAASIAYSANIVNKAAHAVCAIYSCLLCHNLVLLLMSG